MKLSILALSRVFSAGTLAITCLLALPQSVEAKGPKKDKKAKSEHSNGNKYGHDKGRDYAHDESSRQLYVSRPRSVFTLSFGTGYRGQGYYYGPPNSPYYYESPDTRYYATREAAPREYYQNQDRSNGELSTSSSVQRELARLGYYEGSIDGQIGPQSSRSITRYQRDQGLQETGNISSILLQSLGLR